MPSLSEITPKLDEILAAHNGMEGPLLPILHAVQAEWGLSLIHI